jgi:hypothetical protein
MKGKKPATKEIKKKKKRNMHCTRKLRYAGGEEMTNIES